jgi:hypothetical protein
MELFDKNIAILDDYSDQSEFEKLKKKFSQYDSTYVFNAAAQSRRKPIIDAYNKCAEYLDDDFCNQIRIPGKFIDRLWELQICLTLLANDHKIIKRTSGRDYARPDFCIKASNGSNIWIEAVTADLDKYGVVPEKEEITSKPTVRSRKISDTLKNTSPRITNSLGVKFLDKLPKYKKNPEFDGENDFFIIAVNNHKISHAKTGSKTEELVLYGMGLQWIKQNRDSGRYFHWDTEAEKQDGTKVKIEVALFHRPEYKELSAVISSDLWFDFGSNMGSKISGNMNIYFNHNAGNTLANAEINFGNKYNMICEDELCKLEKLQ